MIAIVDYGLGNLASVSRALAHIGHPGIITAEPADIARADRLILPGVGAFAAGMANLAERGLIGQVKDFADSGRPFLGICLGMQLLMEESEEDAAGETRLEGLGIFPGIARLLPGPGKVPHIGWNALNVRAGCPVLGKADGRYVYFVHSYYVDPRERETVAAEADYGLRFAAAIGRGNVLAVQFHPEKSGRVGLDILRAFCEAS